MKRILINSSYGDELRVALVDGAKLYDFDTESPDKTLLKGSIFKATVSRIESSLDAAFVNFGSERHGFLPLKDLSSEFYKKDKKGKFNCTLQEGQEIIVQVTIEERGSKGAALTTQIGLAGRFLVLIPNSSRSGGISRRISGEERDQIKNTLDKLNIPIAPYKDIKTIDDVISAQNEFINSIVKTRTLGYDGKGQFNLIPVSYTHLRAHETDADVVCRRVLEKR